MSEKRMEKDIRDNLSPVFRPLTSAKKSKLVKCTDDDIRLPKIVRPPKRFSDISEKEESEISFNFISTPEANQRFNELPEPMHLTLGTLKNAVHHTKEDSIVLEGYDYKSPNAFDGLGMMDKDISWESSMETPAPDNVAIQNEFNTIERATLLPTKDARNIQPRVLFSPQEDDIECTPLSMESDDDNWNSSSKMVMRSETKINFQKGSTPERQGISYEKDVAISPISPVFRIKRKKSKAKSKRMRPLLVRSPVFESTSNMDETLKKNESSLNISGVKKLDVDKSNFSELTNSIQDDSFQNMSFSCIDELCKNTTDDDSRTENPSISKIVDKVILGKDAKNNDASEKNRFFYDYENKTEDVKALLPGDDLLKSTHKLEQFDGMGVVSKKFDVNDGLTVFKDMIGGSSSLGSKRGRTEFCNENTPRPIHRRKMETYNEEMLEMCSQFDSNDAQICLTAAYAESFLINEKDSKNFSGDIDARINSEKNQTNKQTGQGSEPDFCMFATASGKAISVTDEALQKVKNIFSQESEIEKMDPIDEREDENAFQGFKTASGTSLKVSEKSLQKVESMFRELGVDCDVGFTPAFEKKVKSCEHSLNITENIATNIDKKIKMNEDSTSDKTVYVVSKGDKLCCKENEKISEELNSNKNSSHTNVIFDNQVNCSDKFVPVCEVGVCKSKEAPEKTEGNAEVECCDFSSASVRNVNNSETTLSKLKSTLIECEDEEDRSIPLRRDVEPDTSKNIETEDRMQFDGFSTASGKQVNISAAALEKARKIVGEDEYEHKRNVEEFVGFTTASGKSVAISETALAKARKIIGESKEEDKSKAEEFVGFSTASGKRVAISETALAKAKKIIGEGEEDKSTTEEFVGFSTASGKRVAISETALSKARKIIGEEECEEKPKVEEFVGFSTASGKSVAISESALARARKIIGESEEEDKLQAEEFVGFSTASGKRVAVSETALAKAKKIIGEGEEDKSTSEEFVGFSTASGKSVAVSEAALIKARKIIGEDECKEKPKEFIGFSTASGKSVAVSETALAKARKIIEGEPEKTSNTDAISGCEGEKSKAEQFLGFSTASGKTVTISESSLAKARKVMNENENQEPFTGFCTASGKNVEISEEALAKGNKIIWDTESINIFNAASVENCSVSEKAMKTVQENEEVTTDGTSTGQNVAANESACQEDSAELIPEWLHTYTTSPALMMDRMHMPALTSHEDSRQNSTLSEQYLTTSPVLKMTDRFYNKRKRRKLVFDSSPKTDKKKSDFVVPYKTKKRCLSELDIDFSVPFKKKRTEVEIEVAAEEVIEKRRIARLEQINKGKKGREKPMKGSHWLKKKEEQMSWREAVQGCCPGRFEADTLRKLGLRDDVICVSVSNCVDYRFNCTDFYSTTACSSNINGFPVGDDCHLIFNDDNTAGVEEFARAFFASPGVEPKLISEKWIRNHYKWIVWKLCNYERSFPHLFRGRALTPHNVMVQLKYRYDREIDRSHRSALKKILERDETSTKRMVLCVCDIKKTSDLENADSINKSVISYKLGLTDGWYSCYAQTDSAMTRLVEEGKVHIGVKLVTQGAELLDCDKGVSPLEASEAVHLRISTNSTRRAKWDTKLGAQQFGGPLRISINSILPNGGVVGRIDVIILRVYPILYMEKMSDGSNVTRNSRMEDKAAAAYQLQKEAAMEKIYQKARDEMECKSKEKEKSLKNVSMSDISKINDPEELMQLYEMCPDPSAFQSRLTSEQQESLMDYQRQRREIKNKELMELVQERITAEKMNSRKVSQFLRVKIVDLRNPDFVNPVVFTVWNSTEDVSRMLHEGKVVSILNTMPSSHRLHKPVHLNSTRNTQYRELTISAEYPARRLTRLNELVFDCEVVCNEVDVVGVVVYIQEACAGSRMSQTVYLADLDFNFVGVMFWGCCKDYGWENVLTVNTVVACSNLQWNKKKSSVPVVYVNDSSVFTVNPRQGYLKDEMKALKSALPDDMKQFISKCEEEIQMKLEDQKYNSNSISNLSRNSNDSAHSLSSSLKPKYINAFKMKPTASSTPFKSGLPLLDSCEQEPSPIQKKIERLQMYGEPPPMSPLLPMNNLEKFRKQFKVPFKNANSSGN